MRRWFQNLMYGRYGVDELSRFMLGVCIACLVLNIFTRSPVFYYVELLMLIISYFRMFSKNYAKRSAENAKYLSISQNFRRLGLMKGISQWWNKSRRRMAQSKTHHIYKCPSCGQKIRIPRGKGRIIVTCPKCRHEFEKKS